MYILFFKLCEGRTTEVFISPSDPLSERVPLHLNCSWQTQ